MQAFFWPQHVNPNPGVFARLGRVIHWLGCFYFVALIAGAVSVRVMDEAASASLATVILFSVAMGLAGYLPARAFRYFLAGE